MYNLSKLKEVSQEMLVLVLSLLSLRVGGCTVSMGEAAKPFVKEGVQVSKLEESRTKCLVLRLPRASCRVSGFPMSPQCLGGKLQKRIFFEVSQEVVAVPWLCSV